MLHLALAAALLLPAEPPAERSEMRGFFGATLSITILGQWTAERYFEPDHTYRQTGGDGAVHGVGAIRDGRICTTQDNPPSGRLATYCNTGPGHAPGDSWKDVDPQTGATLLMTLTAGRPAKP